MEALALEVTPGELGDDHPLYEHPISMDSLGFHRVIVELEVLRGGRFDERALEAALFETVGDLVHFFTAEAGP